MKTYVEAEDADILVLTETKSGEPGIAELSERYPVSWSRVWALLNLADRVSIFQHRYWGVDPKKGNAGTAVLSKIEPLEVTFGMPTTDEPQAESAGRASLYSRPLPQIDI